MHTVFLSLGSNLGDRISNIDSAIAEINNLKNTKVIKKSNYYESIPIGFESENLFINVVVKIQTETNPHELLKELKNIEKRLGRIKLTDAYEDRSIDIDIILYDNIILNHENLKIPHPGLTSRLFVLLPLLEIERDLLTPLSNLPVKKLYKSALKRQPKENIPKRIKNC